jgi:acyl-CoA reductase-like NAD-dependent aldehyde dehydrogenase
MTTLAATEIASIVDGKPLPDAPGGRLTSTNPANTSEVVAEVRLGDAETFVAAARAARAPSASGPPCRHPPGDG